jgi:uncharacterized protein (TIGR00725 family)
MVDRARGQLPIVAVIGSGTETYAERARALGEWLARENVHLLTGGGGGVMSSVSKAFHRVPHRQGLVIGVIPCAPEDPAKPLEGYPNPWVEIPIFTHLPHSGSKGMEITSRNHINVLSSAVVVALPGGAGTASEVALALQYGRPLVAFLKSRSEIPGISEPVRVEPELEGVQSFVRTTLMRAAPY